jgi:hypothetical protein
MSVGEENKAIVRYFLEETARGNLDVIDELVAPDFVDRSLLPGQQSDRESFKRSVAEMNAPFSDVSYTTDEQVAEGDKVMTWYTVTSTHDRGPLTRYTSHRQAKLLHGRLLAPHRGREDSGGVEPG